VGCYGVDERSGALPPARTGGSWRVRSWLPRPHQFHISKAKSRIVAKRRVETLAERWSEGLQRPTREREAIQAREQDAVPSLTAVTQRRLTLVMPSSRAASTYDTASELSREELRDEPVEPFSLG